MDKAGRQLHCYSGTCSVQLCTSRCHYVGRFSVLVRCMDRQVRADPGERNVHCGGRCLLVWWHNQRKVCEGCKRCWSVDIRPGCLQSANSVCSVRVCSTKRAHIGGFRVSFRARDCYVWQDTGECNVQRGGCRVLLRRHHQRKVQQGRQWCWSVDRRSRQLQGACT
jgi:hypothetical protein